MTELAKYAVENFPNLHVIARATTRHHVYDLWAIGCRDIIRETYDSSIRIGRTVYEAMGIPRPTAQAMADEWDAMDRRSMIELAGVYDPNIPPTENQAYIDAVKEIRGPWEEQLNERLMEIRDAGEPAAE